MEVLSTNNYLTISYEASTGILFCKWHERQTIESIQSNGELILETFQKMKGSKVLNDNLEVDAQWENAIEWTTSYWFPAMNRSGLKYFAWVLSRNIFARASARGAGENHIGSVRYFETHDEAYHWLSRVQY